MKKWMFEPRESHVLGSFSSHCLVTAVLSYSIPPEASQVTLCLGDIINVLLIL